MRANRSPYNGRSSPTPRPATTQAPTANIEDTRNNATPAPAGVSPTSALKPSTFFWGAVLLSLVTGQNIYLCWKQSETARELRGTAAQSAKTRDAEIQHGAVMSGARQHAVDQQAKLLTQQEQLKKVMEENERIARKIGEALARHKKD